MFGIYKGRCDLTKSVIYFQAQKMTFRWNVFMKNLWTHSLLIIPSFLPLSLFRDRLETRGQVNRMLEWEAETLILWPPDAKNWLTGKDPDAGKDWRREKKGNDRGWDGWMATPTRWTWVWVNSGSWWWTGKPGVLQSVGSQRVGHDWATELNWEWDEMKKWSF